MKKEAFNRAKEIEQLMATLKGEISYLRDDLKRIAAIIADVNDSIGYDFDKPASLTDRLIANLKQNFNLSGCNSHLESILPLTKIHVAGAIRMVEPHLLDNLVRSQIDNHAARINDLQKEFDSL